MNERQVGIAVIGAGYWGPNLIRNFYQLRESRVVAVVDVDEDRLAHIQELYPSVRTTTSYQEVLDNPEVEAVVLAVPVHLHAPLALQAITAGKHVLLEKPMAATVAQCDELIEAAETHGRVLMVGHVFEYTSAVRKVRELLDSGVLGDLYYVNSQRLNLGLFRNDVNVIWDLAPHDISILLHLLDGRMPRGVRAVGVAHINPKVEDVATISLDFDDGLIAFIQVSWLDPKKVRQTVLVGSKQMLVYDDIEPTEKIWLYDRGVEAPPRYDTYDQFPYTYRYGDITIPRIGGVEPLRAEAQHFVECVREGRTPLTDGHSGRRVVRILEATSESLAKGGARIEILDS